MVKKNWKTRVTLVLIILALIFYYFYLIHDSCKDWDKGLGNTRILNNVGECRIETPNYCELSIRDGFFDLTRFKPLCAHEDMKVNRMNFPEKFKHKKNLRQIGYPRIESMPGPIKMDHGKYKEWIEKRVIDMDDPDIPQATKDNIEFTVTLTGKESDTMNMQLKKNTTRAEEQKALRDKILGMVLVKISSIIVKNIPSPVVTIFNRTR